MFAQVIDNLFKLEMVRAKKKTVIPTVFSFVIIFLKLSRKL